MSSTFTTLRRALRQAGTSTALALLFLPFSAALAMNLDVRTANIGLIDGHWRLTARIDYRLTDEVQKALENGVALTFRVEVEIDRVRRWLPNADVVSTAYEWQLSYEPLSERYVVHYPDERERSSHATLFGALNAMGRVQALPVIDEPQLAGGETYLVSVRALLSEQKLPAPLWLLGLWSTGFSLKSEWYEWTFVP